MASLTEAETMALKFLSSRESDCVGMIDDEHKLAAAIVYAGLDGDGLVAFGPSDAGPVYRITPAGRSALAQDGDRGGADA